MLHFLDISFLISTGVLSLLLSFVMFFSRKVEFVAGGVVILYFGFWCGTKAIDRFKGDFANQIDFQQDLSAFLLILVFTWYVIVQEKLK